MRDKIDHIVQLVVSEGIHIGMALGVLVGVGVLMVVVSKLFNRLETKVSQSNFFDGFKIRNFEVLDPAAQVQLTNRALDGVKWLVILFIAYVALPIIFSFFPFTKDWAEFLFDTIEKPAVQIATSVWEYIPNLLIIAMIVVCTVYTIKAMKFLAKSIESGKLHVPGFYPDWAMPTLNIVKFLTWVLMFTFIFPYLPGSDSPVFQGVSVIVGLLFSFGSGSAISNMVAGLVITYMRPFQLGDRIRFGDVTGDVVEKSLLVTRIRTIKNVDITIPNSSILSSHTVNYSSTPEEPVILHTTVTIGYDVQWRHVHEMLREAAGRSANIIDEPKPFVLQTSLDDFYVSYELNAATDRPDLQAKTYSELHKHIQDVFMENDVEIMSPHYQAEREEAPTTIPKPYKKKDA